MRGVVVVTMMNPVMMKEVEIFDDKSKLMLNKKDKRFYNDGIDNSNWVGWVALLDAIELYR